jgi:hypothetical protein
MRIQLAALLQVENFDKKSSDKIGPLYVILGVIANVAVAFGKPYTPVYFLLGALLLSLVIAGNWRGLWEWCGLFFGAATPFCIALQYFWNGYWYGHTS